MIARQANESTVRLTCVPTSVYDGIGRALADHSFACRFTKGNLDLAAKVANVSWQEYKAFLLALGDLHVRHCFTDGLLNIMSPLHQHDWIKRLISRFIETLAYDQNIPIKSIGSTTITSEKTERGFEADEAYYIASEAKVRGKLDFVPDRDPPPDLIIEIDVTSSSEPKLALFAVMKVSEVWLHDGNELRFLNRHRGSYREVENSIAFPYLNPGDITRFLDRRAELDETQLVKQFVAWARRRRKAFEKEQNS